MVVATVGELTRKPDWELALDRVIQIFAAKPYRLGSSDCLRLACAAVAAMTGVDLWRRWSGRYYTHRGALRQIRYYGNTLCEAVTAVLEVDPGAPLTARRGDLLAYRDANGEHLGVCVGGLVAIYAADGLGYVTLDDARLTHAWRIG